MDTFDRGPVDMWVNGKRQARYARAFTNGEDIFVYAEWKLNGVTQVYRSNTFSDLSVLAGEIRWMDGSKTYRLTKAVGCGCNYNKLSIKSATQEGLINA